ncbi:4-diphosphocytidyl-2-C-methyl-D-erythritol kinase (CMK) (4-(cytidine-5'-diphospho)-2-C-methyl-D-erythritol kinase) [Herminiimonas arsenicoxydans]|uniref:4-diphosphocytidyl-2-C-methyl-D-erythritol kinase n=1 Tax=Herminiimonas arsenicoxydans TaxID=204773 RepID=ISPE_HERAR|nr:RecName: Full=4-diphosphocytidyl-2-C-methyl-D-erythritol kinase; Short=CMK; AltName: Full=4-(cytidine-5'-diphospho)-2-C-methyl-D-erythritol kinase [Herminiimonas arsenicoxydans]CAL63006.1 4-diphosphocytidyl-2-C-methyl-D-erythritol kinase (CMK) (4-(cytidine-5'-diphospho)-2-C-methyl-D-erythritol kinase) [Herminiimonas arsenicoxydans]
MVRTLNNCPAPAKLNLFLHVTGRRADGYHLLQSVFQLIDRGDVLHFSVRDDGLIHRSTELAGVPADSDLVVRAARLLQTEAKKQGKTPGADIAIEKKLPMGGGLGGGSSDAATTLLALNHLWQTGLTRAELMALGLQLGADVPFFLFGQNAFAEGIGEALMAVKTPESWFLVIEPGVSVPTQQIFSSLELTRDTKPVKISDFSRAQESFGKNDLQVVAANLFPPIADAIKWLQQFGDARMTGSGACVFCPFKEEQQVDAVLATVPQQWKAWKAKAITHHPLAYLAT